MEQMLELTDIRESKVFSEGRQEGRQHALRQVAVRLLAKGDSVAEVAAITGLPVAQVKKLKNKHPAKE
jgi:predicted transposase YdaD